MKSDNILLHGIFSENLGDDLFFRIILKRCPESRFIMYAPQIYRDILKDFSNCIILCDSDKAIKRILKYSRLLHLPKSLFLYVYIFIKYNISIFLIAGGSIFIEGNSHVPKLVSNIRKLCLIFPKTKICILGSNFGPSSSNAFKVQVDKCISKVNDICFRDIPSYELFQEHANVRWANDIVMHDLPLCIPQKTRSICVNIRSVNKWPSLKPNKTKYLNKTKDIIEYYQKLGYEIKLLSFCGSYGDNDITDELYSMLGNKQSVERLYYKGNLDECILAISSAEYILATRFHSIVLGLIYGAKTIPVSYSIKAENMLKTLGHWKKIYSYNEYCNAKVEDIIANMIVDFKVDQSNNRQFDYLDSILK